jgi:uncharacterized protein YecT (DUF1311 family)
MKTRQTNNPKGAIMRYFLLTSLITLALSAPLMAKTEYSQAFNDCAANIQLSHQVIDCMSQETAVQDKRLNDLYKQVSNIQTPATKQLLLTAQRNWLQYRDNWVKFLKTQQGDSGPEYLISEFLLDATLEQADHLQSILNGMQ